MAPNTSNFAGKACYRLRNPLARSRLAGGDQCNPQSSEFLPVAADPCDHPSPQAARGSRKQTPLPPQAAASPEGALGIRSPPLPLSDLQSLCPQDQAQPQLELGKAKSGPQQGPPMSLLLNKGKMTILAWHKGTYARLAGPNGHK